MIKPPETTTVSGSANAVSSGNRAKKKKKEGGASGHGNNALGNMRRGVSPNGKPSGHHRLENHSSGTEEGKGSYFYFGNRLMPQ